MELIITLFYTCFALFFVFQILKHFTRKQHNLPPSPALALPVIGHLHLLKQPIHRTLHRFSQTHGPIFSLKLGVRRIVVVSSPDLVEQCFTTNDVVFSNRPRILVDEYIGYNHTTIVGTPYGPHWRNLRRLGTQEVLSPARLNAFSHIRQDEVRRTLKTLIHANNGFTKVELRPTLFKLIFNTITRMLAGNRYFNSEEEDNKSCYSGDQFLEMVSMVFEKAEASNPEDFLPFLNWIDYRGLKKELTALGKKLDDFYQGLLEEHRKEKRNTIIGHLLSLQESDPQFYTDQTIKGFVANVIVAGTDTTILTIEWAMSVLLNHPHVLQKAKLELDSHVGHQRLLEEQDLSNLHYLRNIISETFRMFPAGPLVVPREASVDCEIGGYDVPRETILLVNAWAIQRDSEVWDEPTTFRPERFEGKEVETQMLMPFGMGRRACPGAGLGQRMVGLALGSLIQCFDWERVNMEEVDLTEGVGISMPKLKPLEVMCRPREIMLKILQESEGSNFTFLISSGAMAEQVHTIEDLCGNLQLEEEEEGGLVIDEGEIEKQTQDLRWCLVGRFLANRHVNFQSMKNTLAAIRRPVKGVFIKDLSPNLFLFQFFHELDVARVEANGRGRIRRGGTTTTWRSGPGVRRRLAKISDRKEKRGSIMEVGSGSVELIQCMHGKEAMYVGVTCGEQVNDVARKEKNKVRN
ncbi:hypothetical protein DH2020_010490 [Rehmannia glutinosa]|uniref:DUF4283 domain-containing protein n=1 Tax=Rehmannia glutinosa TaxID=99300 RepID=A0ABR0XAR6_REHGL